jgi:hypothetical protein
MFLDMTRSLEIDFSLLGSIGVSLSMEPEFSPESKLSLPDRAPLRGERGFNGDIRDGTFVGSTV